MGSKILAIDKNIESKFQRIIDEGTLTENGVKQIYYIDSDVNILIIY